MSTTLLKAAKAYAKAHPVFTDGGSWNGHCGSLLHRFNGHTIAYATPADAYRNRATAAQPDAAKAPVGAFHFFSLPNGLSHAGQDMTGGGRSLFMGSAHLASLATPKGVGIGFQSASAYVAATGAVYLGWTLFYGRNRVARAASDLHTVSVRVVAAETKAAADRRKVKAVAAYLNKRYPKTPTAASRTGLRTDKGKVRSIYWRLIQQAGRADGLYGRGYIITGIPGPRSRYLEAYYAKRVA